MHATTQTAHADGTISSRLPARAMERPKAFKWAPLACLALAWLAMVAVCLWKLGVHDNTPGESATAPARWPGALGLTLDPGRPTLLMFIHPLCPCSRASIAELATLLAERKDAFSVHVLEHRPHDTAGEAWSGRSDVTRLATTGILATTWDNDGAMARRFGARTSGQVVIYGADGALLYAGGLTGARGHAGDNPGLRAARAAAAGSAVASCSVFGCSLGLSREEAQPAQEPR